VGNTTPIRLAHQKYLLPENQFLYIMALIDFYDKIYASFINYCYFFLRIFTKQKKDRPGN